MELNHLKYFYVVAREGGFTRASKALRVQQPAVSKAVKNLEDRLGLILLERHKREVRLTKAGREIFRSCENIFRYVEDIAVFSRAERTECSGPLAFGCSDSVASCIVPKVLKAFLRAHPKVRPSVFSGTSSLICDEILAGRIEFGIFFTVPEEPSLEVVDLMRVPFHLVVSAARAGALDVRTAFIGSREIDYSKTRSFPALEMLRKVESRAEIFISSNNLDCHKQLVLEGLGVALLPRFMVRGKVKSGALRVLLPERQFSYPLRLVTRRGKVLSRNALEFIENFRKRGEALV